MSAGNVRELLQRRMIELDEEIQLLLQYAACLGSSFSLSKLALVWEKHALEKSSELVEDSDNVGEIFTILVEERFIELCGEETFRWVHDKVQEAALALCDANRKDSFQYEIGSILYHNLDEKEKEEMLFDIANLVNKGGPKQKYVELNLRAAEKARAISAFQSVATYVSNGIGGLPSEKWTTHKDLTLRLHTLGAQMGYSLRDKKMIERFSSEVLCQEGCSALEKVQVYCAKINQQMIEDPTFKSAIDLSLVALKELGCPIKGNKVTLAVKAGISMLKSLKKAKNTSEESYRSLKIMTDPEAVAVMHLLCNLEVILYLTGDVSLLLIASTRRINLTFEYGIHDSSAHAFSFLGMLACTLGQYESGTYLGEQALYMQSKATSNYYKSQAFFSLYYSVFPWSQPLHSCLPPLLEGYNSGLRTGNVEIGGACLYFHHIEIPLCLGKSLAQIQDNARFAMSQLSAESFVDSTKMISQLILNLRGQAPDVTVLKGEYFNIEEFTMKTPVQSAAAWNLRLWIMTIYGLYQKAADEAISNGNGYYQKNFASVSTVMTEMFLRGVVLYATARQTKKRKYKRCAKNARKTFLNWQKKGNPNVQHYECLLSAEDAALSKNYSRAEKLYVQTITLAARSGSLYVAALANERYGDLLKTQLSDYEEAKYRTKEAIRFFKDWGAEAKVQMLEDSLL